MANDLSSPLCAGLPYRMGTCLDSSEFTQFQAVKLTGPNTYAPCATTDGDEDVHGIALATRLPGDSRSVPICPITSPYPFPVLSDGAGLITVASATLGFLTLSGASGGRFKGAAAGILRAMSSSGAVADATVLASPLTGSGSSSGAGTLGADYVAGGGGAGSNNTLGSAGTPMDDAVTLIMEDDGLAGLVVQNEAEADRVVLETSSTAGGVIRGGDIANGGADLLVRAGDSTDAAANGGDITVKSGQGGDGDAVLDAGDGGDLIIVGGDAGAEDPATKGGHGGNVFIKGGLGTNTDPTAPVHQHGGIIIGEEQTDEIRIGHEPVYETNGFDLGHVRFTGYLAEAGATGTAGYSLRFAIEGAPHVIDGAPQPNDEAPGISLTYTAGRGGDADTNTGGQGGSITVGGAAGGDGSATDAAGAGGDVNITGGAAGTAAAGGGGAGGDVIIDGGAASGAGLAGNVYVGASSPTLSTTIGRPEVTTTIYGLGSTNLYSEANATIQIGQRTVAGAGRNLTLAGGQGLDHNGGDIVVKGGAYDAGSGQTFGGSAYIDGGAGDTQANSGIVLVGTQASTFQVKIGQAGFPVNLTGLPQSESVPTLASGTTIAPTTLVAKVSGTTTVSTITLPYASFKGTVILIPTGVWAWDTNGNIAIAGVSVVSKALHMTCDGTTWYPSYVA